MSLASDVKALLTTDATLVAMLTGGIYTRTELGQLGDIHDTTLPIYDANETMLPHAVIRARDQLPFGRVSDLHEQQQSTRQMVEVRVYDDATAGYGIVTPARKLVFRLLVGKHTGEGAILLPAGTHTEDYDPALENACWESETLGAHLVRNSDYD